MSIRKELIKKLKGNKKYIDYKDYVNKIQQIDRLRFIDDTTKQSYKNLMSKQNFYS